MNKKLLMKFSKQWYKMHSIVDGPDRWDYRNFLIMEKALNGNQKVIDKELKYIGF